jgi:hypothetical protein
MRYFSLWNSGRPGRHTGTSNQGPRRSLHRAISPTTVLDANAAPHQDHRHEPHLRVTCQDCGESDRLGARPPFISSAEKQRGCTLAGRHAGAGVAGCAGRRDRQVLRADLAGACDAARCSGSGIAETPRKVLDLDGLRGGLVLAPSLYTVKSQKVVGRGLHRRSRHQQRRDRSKNANCVNGMPLIKISGGRVSHPQDERDRDVVRPFAFDERRNRTWNPYPGSDAGRPGRVTHALQLVGVLPLARANALAGCHRPCVHSDDGLAHGCPANCDVWGNIRSAGHGRRRNQ